VAVLGWSTWGLLINVEPVPGETLETRDFLDRPITQGGELAQFRVESRVPLEVVVNQAPHVRLAFNDGLNYDWHPFELIEWVSQTVAQFAVVFR
jgi:hypothetical protein